MVPIPFNWIFQKGTMNAISPFKAMITTTIYTHFNNLPWKNYICICSLFKLQHGELLTSFLTLNCMREVTEGRGSVRLGRGWRSVESLTLRDILRQRGPWPLCSSSFDILTPTWGHWDGKDSHTTRQFCRALWKTCSVLQYIPSFHGTKTHIFIRIVTVNWNQNTLYWCNIR